MARRRRRSDVLVGALALLAALFFLVAPGAAPAHACSYPGAPDCDMGGGMSPNPPPPPPQHSNPCQGYSTCTCVNNVCHGSNGTPPPPPPPPPGRVQPQPQPSRTPPPPPPPPPAGNFAPQPAPAAAVATPTYSPTAALTADAPKPNVGLPSTDTKLVSKTSGDTGSQPFFLWTGLGLLFFALCLLLSLMWGTDPEDVADEILEGSGP